MRPVQWIKAKWSCRVWVHFFLLASIGIRQTAPVLCEKCVLCQARVSICTGAKTSKLIRVSIWTLTYIQNTPAVCWYRFEGKWKNQTLNFGSHATHWPGCPGSISWSLQSADSMSPHVGGSTDPDPRHGLHRINLFDLQGLVSRGAIQRWPCQFYHHKRVPFFVCSLCTCNGMFPDLSLSVVSFKVRRATMRTLVSTSNRIPHISLSVGSPCALCAWTVCCSLCSLDLRQGFDILSDCVSQDLTSVAGFMVALSLRMRLCPAALLFAALPCASFCWVSSATHGRNGARPWGLSEDFVTTGNTLVTRLCLLLAVGLVRGVAWVVENPMRSAFELLPPLMHMLHQNLRPRSVTWSLCAH